MEENDHQDKPEKQANKEINRQSNDYLFSRYWRQVYRYLRRKGYDIKTSEDLTQNFIKEMVLERDIINRYFDDSKEELSSFLICKLNRYLINKENDRRCRYLRFPQIPLPQNPRISPLIAEILRDISFEVIQVELRKEIKDICYEVFEATVLNPIYGNTKSPSITNICEKYGIATEEAYNMILMTQSHLKECIMHSLQQKGYSSSKIKEEISNLQNLVDEMLLRT